MIICMIMLNWIMNILFKQINIRAAFHIYIIGIKKDNKTDFLPSVDYVFNIEDHLLVIGKKKDVDMILKCMS